MISESVGTPLIRAKDLSIIYTSYGEKKRAVDNISFELRKGEILGIVGESGAGKSTIAKAIMGLIEPPSYATGEIIYNGKNLIGMKNYKINKIRWNKITMIFQASMNSLNPVQTVESNFISIMKDKMGIYDRSQWDRIMEDMLASVSLPLDVKKKFPHQLSGGMRQRILISMAMITNPEIVIADEPTTALDVITEFYVLSVLKEKIRSSGASMIFITHDLPAIVFMANRLAVMRDGKIIEIGNVSRILSNPENEYTKKLVNSFYEVET
ncbi:ABC transporter ATP-binding protein [Cuniculiplasma sp. SKW3]|uniref:ABC transporter ATP-binding protein n=1 Tax=unclassified Cuniculiplasma TaxID=2619706 RepID=UPI003FD4C084